jgi:hypothetical protein
MLQSPTGMTIAAMMKETGWREAGRPVFAPAGDQPNAHRVPTRHEPVAVVLELMNLVGVGRRLVGWGWQVIHSANTTEH